MLLPLLFSLSLFAADQPQDSTVDSLFTAGLGSYQSQKFEEAKSSFQKALDLEPDNENVMTNLALAHFQLGNKPLAVALLRRAQNLDPNFSTPRAALEFILPQLNVVEIPHEIQITESFRSSFLSPFSPSVYLILTAVLLSAFGWVLLGYLGARRRAYRELTPLPAFPLSLAALGVALFLSLGLTIFKLIDHRTPRGTVIVDKVAVLSAPDEKAVALFELFGGLEITIEDSVLAPAADGAEKPWAQVTYPGAFTGWIPRDAVLQTSGNKKW